MLTRRITLALLTALTLLLGTFVGAPTASSSTSDSDVIAGAWIVTVKDGYSSARVAHDHAARHGARVSHVYRHALNGYAAKMSDTAAARVARDSRVSRVEADRVVRASAQTTPTGVDRIDGELSAAAKIDGVDERVDVDVAIIDTGIISTHSDLNVVGGVNCSRGSSWEDGNGHGTHVAGTVAALDNDLGVVGVAPGARLWAVRVLDNSGSGSWSSVQCGVDWVTGRNTDNVATNDIEVANMSLGGSSSEVDTNADGTSNCKSSSMHESICNSVNAGVTYAVAAGNSGADAKNYVPAKYDEVITVSALADFDGLTGGNGSPTCRTDEDDTFANFSNYGADVDIIAPGVCINSTWKDGGYKTISGTSMAAPHVAGAAALHKAANTSATPAQVKSALQSTGNTNWNDIDDPDSTKEQLLNVDAFDTAKFVTTSTDGDGGGSTNTAPMSYDDSTINVTSGNYVDITLKGTDPDSGDCDLTFTIATTPAKGQLGTLANQSCTSGSPNQDFATVRYTPNATSSDATDSFTYTVNDGEATSTAATITISITGSGSTESPSTTTATDDIDVTQFGGKSNDNHADLTVSIAAGTTILPGSTVTVSVTKDGGAFDQVTATTGDSGTFTFGYRGLASGAYVATIANVIPPDGYTWDGVGDSVSWSKTSSSTKSYAV